MSEQQILRALKAHFSTFIHDEHGAVLSSELALVGTLGVLATVVGLESVSTAVNQELNDFGGAISSLDQSYSVRGLSKPGHARVAGTCFINRNANFNNQLNISEVCGGDAALGVTDMPSVSSFVSEPVEVREVTTDEDCSNTPTTIRETHAPRTTTVTVSVTDSEVTSHVVPNSTACENKTSCVKGLRETVIHEEVIGPDGSSEPKSIQPTPEKKFVPKEKSKTIPQSKAAPSKSQPSKAPPKTAPKTQIPKPQADR